MPSFLHAPRAAKRASLLCAFIAVGASATAARADNPQWNAPDGYYDAAIGVGSALKSQLYTIMRTGHIERRYGDFRSSAAIHDADPDVEGNIILGYDGTSVRAQWDAGATWNREHVWPQSRQPGDASNSTRGNLGDPHALLPMRPFVNGSRGNSPYGFANTTGPYGSVGAYFYPGDDDAGDVARMCFYSDTRYGPTRGISLVRGFPSGYEMGDLNALIAWHYIDPPDEFERRRNHTIATASYNPFYYTNNRNAFVDHPEFAWSIYEDQQNDSRLYVGDQPDADGGSLIEVDLGPALVGGPAPTQDIVIKRDGFDGTYYEVEATDGAAASSEGRYNAFPINTGGADEQIITLSMDDASTTEPGMRTGVVRIDNLDITTEGGPGRGANDADDFIAVRMTVLQRAETSFDADADINERTIDFGQSRAGARSAPVELCVHHLGDSGAMVADVDVELVETSGDASAFGVAFTSIDDLPPGDAVFFDAALDAQQAGEYEAVYRFRVFDDRDLPGAGPVEDLVLTLTASVAPGACAADLDGDGAIDSADLAALLGTWGAPGAADIDGDGEVNSADLAYMLGTWGACAD